MYYTWDQQCDHQTFHYLDYHYRVTDYDQLGNNVTDYDQLGNNSETSKKPLTIGNLKKKQEMNKHIKTISYIYCCLRSN